MAKIKQAPEELGYVAKAEATQAGSAAVQFDAKYIRLRHNIDTCGSYKVIIERLQQQLQEQQVLHSQLQRDNACLRSKEKVHLLLR